MASRTAAPMYFTVAGEDPVRVGGHGERDRAPGLTAADVGLGHRELEAQRVDGDAA